MGKIPKQRTKKIADIMATLMLSTAIMFAVDIGDDDNNVVNCFWFYYYYYNCFYYCYCYNLSLDNIYFLCRAKIKYFFELKKITLCSGL